MITDNINNPDENTDDEGGEGGGTAAGGSGSGKNFESWIPGFNDFLQAPEDQKNLRDFYAQITRENRLEAKKQGIDVQALNKKQQLKQDIGNYNYDGVNNSNPSGGGTGFDQHPLIQEYDGIIILPDSEQEIRNDANNPELKNSLKMGLSMRAALELKNKQRYRNEPEQPRYRPRSAPKPRPF